MEIRENVPNSEYNNKRRSYSPVRDAIASETIIEELLSVKYDTLNDADQTDIATTIRNAILIPNNLNVSDDCLRILCNQREYEATLVLDTTVESPASVGDNENAPPTARKHLTTTTVTTNTSSQSSSTSDIISDQDQRCAREQGERRVLRQVSPLPKGIIISGNPILNGENSGNAVFNRFGADDEAKLEGETKETAGHQQLTFNGRIPAPPPERKPDHVIIQIEADKSMEKIEIEGGEIEEEDETTTTTIATEKNRESFEYTNEKSPDLFADDDDEDDDEEEDDDKEDIANGQDEMKMDCEKKEIEKNKSHITLTELSKGDERKSPSNSRRGSRRSSRSDEVMDEARQVVETKKTDRLQQRDTLLCKRIQSSCSGVVPPPSITNVTISLDVIIARYKEFNGEMPETKKRGDGEVEVAKKETVADKDEVDADTSELHLMKSVDSPTKAKTEEWPELKKVICHDVYYNLSNAMEQFEYLTVKYRSRFLGTETASSFVLADLSSAKKRANRTKALQGNNASPGRRLSHLARRRAIFSCANLQGAKDAAAQAQRAAADLSRVANRQILLPGRRIKGRTPGKKRKTPSSSAKKRSLLATSALQQRRAALTREGSKRMLFQSPGGNKGTAGEGDTEAERSQQPAKPKVTPEVAIRVDKSKRALFSSPKFGRYPTFSGAGSSSMAGGGGGGAGGSSSARMELSRLRFSSMNSLAVADRGSQENLKESAKRKRDDYSDEDEENNGKMLRTESPRRASFDSMAGGGDATTGSGGASGKNFMRSQSFTAEQLYRQKSSMGLPRTSSEMYLAGGTGQVLALTESEKKKLLWTVSQTLLRNQVENRNPKFREYATVMAKVVKRLYLETVNKPVISVTEQMAKLANNIAFQVLQNKNELEIYSAEKLRIQSMNRKKLTGYINSMDYERYKLTTTNRSLMRRMSSGVFSEASSQVSLSQSSVASTATVATMNSVAMDENRDHSQSIIAVAEKALTMTTTSATSSYSVLRENVDTEQRQQQQLKLSSQKLSFSGRDQKNVSPFSGDGTTKRKLLVGGAGGGAQLLAATATMAKGLNVIKAKRQISFDT